MSAINFEQMLSKPAVSCAARTPVAIFENSEVQMTHDVQKYASGGYTLIEAIVVLVVVGVLSATMLTRTDAVTKRAVPDQADQLRRDLAHIQSLALTYGMPLRLNISSTGYTVSCPLTTGPCTKDLVLSDPTSGQNFSQALATDVTMTSTDAAQIVANTVDFDSSGRPFFNGTMVATNPVRTFSFTGASRTSVVVLRPFTGFAEVTY